MHDPFVQIAGELVDLAQDVDFGRESGLQHRVFVGIKFAVCANGGSGHGATAVGHGQTGVADGTAQRLFVNGAGMAVSGGFTAHSPQAESLGCIKTGGFYAPVVE